MHTLDIDKLTKAPSAWLCRAPGACIAVSSRVRLARNLEGIPFPARCQAALRQSVQQRVGDAAAASGRFPGAVLADVSGLDATQRDVLLERRLLSRELCASGTGGGVLFLPDGALSLLINEEDHLRVQALLPGLSLGAAWQRVSEAEEALGNGLPYAFDPNWGYLTSCPTNLGTGLRASVMLHLPGLGLAGISDALVNAIRALGFEVRGALGEGTEAISNLFQISNQSTLGESEREIISRLERLVHQVVWHEQSARLRLVGKQQRLLYDTVGRAYGVLRHARSLTVREALDGLSALRLGVDMRLFGRLQSGNLDDLFLAVQPGHLQCRAGRSLSARQQDEYRADLVRAVLAGDARSGSSAEDVSRSKK